MTWGRPPLWVPNVDPLGDDPQTQMLIQKALVRSLVDRGPFQITQDHVEGFHDPDTDWGVEAVFRSDTQTWWIRGARQARPLTIEGSVAR